MRQISLIKNEIVLNYLIYFITKEIIMIKLIYFSLFTIISIGDIILWITKYCNYATIGGVVILILMYTYFKFIEREEIK